ncbi:MAG: hypothetical protein SF162_14745 [bacterium]|nr:hypothetical protein [bacterium]
MNVFFHDDGRAPLPKADVRIEKVELFPYPDRFRVYVHITVSLFQERPNLLLAVRDSENRIAAELSIIETMHHDMEFTMHLRGRDDTAGTYTFTADLFYETRNPPQDRRVETFEIPPADEPGDPNA